MKLMALLETEVFLNEQGGVTILQKCWPDEDSVICLFGDQIELVAMELAKLSKENVFDIVDRSAEE